MLSVPRLLLGLLSAQALAACGGGAADRAPATAGPAPTSTMPPSSTAAWQGRFVGTVTIGAAQYYGDALLTIDGAVRLYIGGPYAPDGVVQRTRPATSAQFVGTVEGHGDKASGSGVVIGQNCAGPAPGPLCGAAASSHIDLAVNSGNISGEIKVTAPAGAETWSLALSEWNNYYVLPARPDRLAGQYREQLADFALDGDTLVSVDAAGRLFFQSANSGCIGNGTVAPHLNGEFNVYDVALTVQSCNATYAYLNGTFAGLATTSPSTRWDYDSLLRAWLSRQDGAASQAAVTMLGEPL